MNITPFSRSTTLSSLAMVITTMLYVIQKTDIFTSWRFFSHTTPIYVLWLLTIACAAYITLHHPLQLLQRIQNFFLTLLPSFFILCLTPFLFDTHIHWFVTTISGFYFVVYGLFFVYTYHKKNDPKNSTSQKPLQKYHIAFMIITTCLYLYFGIDHLGKAFYVDEKLWVYDRIETYWDNIMTGDWYNTRPSDKPGVTTAILSGPGLLFFDPSDFNEGAIHKNQLEDMFFAMRLPIFIGICTLLILVFFCARAILPPLTALIFFILLTLSPLLIGVARMINPDALLWIFFVISFVSFMRYLFDRSLPALYCTGIFIGLSLLTKYIANIFIVFYFFIILLDLIMRKEHYADIVTALREHLIRFGIMIIIALSVFYILYPGTWVKHDRILLATVHSEAFASTWPYFATFVFFLIIDLFLLQGAITTKIVDFFRSWRTWIAYGIMGLFGIFFIIMLINVYTNMSIFDFMYIIESPKSVYRTAGVFALLETSFYPLFFGVTPIVLCGFLIGYIQTIRTKLSDWNKLHYIILYSTIFIMIYYLGSIINHVMPIVRYQIVLYPLMILIASIGWSFLFTYFVKNTKYILIFCTLFVIMESTQLYTLHHYYFSYNDPLLPQNYIINSKDMGDGNYEIAQYLNALPNAKDLLVWTDKTGLCQFFVGSCNNMIQDMSLVNIAPDIDYYVISQNRQGYIERLTDQKRDNRSDYPIRLDRLYATNNKKIFEILPGGRDAQFIRILDARDITIIDHIQ